MDDKYYTNYVNKSVTISYKQPKNNNSKKGITIRGTYDIETNNEVGKFIVGGLALNNLNNSENIEDNYNITFHNKPYLILQEIYKHNQLIGGNNRYEIAVHNLIFDIQSLLYNIIEKDAITYKEPGVYGKQAKNTYSIIMNSRKQIFSCTINYSGVIIIFWDSFKLYPASLKSLCETYQLKNYKLEAGEETYNSKDFDSFVNDKVNVDYLKADLLSLAELIDKNLYKKKTASSNAWDNMNKSICKELGSNRSSEKIIAKQIFFWGDNKLNDHCLPGYSGGFCYANPKRSNELIQNVLHLDINSSYPNAMYNLDLPIGNIENGKKITSDRYIIYLKGEFILKENSFPVIKSPIAMNQYLNYYKGDILLTDIEYERIKKNYNINKEKIIEVMNFPTCKKILRNFVETNYKMKQEATGFLRLKAKLNLNSAYGKLAEHHNKQFYEAYIDDKKLKFRLSKDSAMLIDTSSSRCVVWAMFITSFAREKLFRCMDILGDKFIYTDTDSIFTDMKEEELREKFSQINEEIDDKNLGAWAIEGYSPYFKVIRAKCYLKTDNNRLNYVIAGYNGTELLDGLDNHKINDKIESDIVEYDDKFKDNVITIGYKHLMNLFNNFKIGRVCHDKLTSMTAEYGIKQVKILTDFEIKEKLNKFDFVKDIDEVIKYEEN